MHLSFTRRIGDNLNNPAISYADPDLIRPATRKQRSLGVKDHADSLDLNYVQTY